MRALHSLFVIALIFGFSLTAQPVPIAPEASKPKPAASEAEKPAEPKLIEPGITPEPRNTTTEAKNPEPEQAAAKPPRYAQINVAEIYGSISIASVTASATGYSSATSTQFNFSPGISYFLLDGFSIGVTGSVSVVSDSYTNLAVYFSPGYTRDLKSIFFPYVRGLIGYADIAYSSAVTGQSGVGYGGSLGLKTVIAENVLLNFGLQYLVQNYVFPGTVNTPSATLISKTLSAAMGFSFFF